MLEGLDQVDWGSLGKLVYAQPATKVPELVRDLLSNDKNVRDEALAHLFGAQQDLGSIQRATPFIIPFIIEILADENTPERVSILWCLHAMFDYLQGSVVHPNDVRELQLYAKVYEAIEADVTVYLSFLKNSDADIQHAAVVFLGNLRGKDEQLIPELIRLFEVNVDKSIATIALASIGRLLSPRDDLPRRFGIFLRDVAANRRYKIEIRRAAAKALASSLFLYADYYKDVLAGIAPLLADEYVELSAQHDIYFYYLEQLAKQIAMVDFNSLVELLKAPKINLHDVHIIARIMLMKVFDRWIDWEVWISNSLGRYGLISDKGKNEKCYSFTPAPELAFLLSEQRDVLALIVANDKFWQIPTNLFSFFYGLPDSREELRRLIEKN
jgi:hypothetical protein